MSVDYDMNVDFSKYSTYGWMLDQGTQAPEMTERRIRRILEEQLQVGGLSEAAGGEPDLYVVTHASIGTALQINSTNTGMVDLVDTKTDQLVWRGIAKGSIPNKAKKSEKKIAKAVAKLFRKFPPVPKEK